MRTCFCLAVLAACALEAQEKAAIKRVPLQPTDMTSGKEMFKTYCATCHGPGGKGDGPAVSALKKTPADLTQLARKHDGKFPDAYVTAKLKNVDEPIHGSREMPIWGALLPSVSQGEAETQLRINNLVGYIASIQAK